jgi:HEAT repeat protein
MICTLRLYYALEMRFSVVSVIFAFFILSIVPDPSSAAPTFRVQWHQNRLSISANGAPLGDIIAEVARQTGTEVRGAQVLKRCSHLQLSDLALRDALRTMLAKVNYAIVNKSAASDARPTLLLIIHDDPSSHASSDDLAHQASKASASPKVPMTPDEMTFKETDNLRHAAEAGDLHSLRSAAVKGDSVAQSVALQLLAEKDPPQASRFAIVAAHSSDIDRRLNALQVLREIDTPASAATLGAALKDPALAVRQAALDGLVGQTEPDTVMLLVEATRDRDPSIRIQALEFLSQRGSAGEEGLNRALSSPDLDVRSRARELLDQMNPAP